MTCGLAAVNAVQQNGAKLNRAIGPARRGPAGERASSKDQARRGVGMDSGVAVTGISLAILVVYLAASGLIVGALARWLLPGPDPMSWLATIGFGLAGSFLGGLVGRLVNAPTILDLVLSVAGAALLIWFFRRRKPSQPLDNTPK
jgi:uncharacterized membrane protein YeaQ/YmgE (transglycosylase-associated protein family)